MNRKGEIVIITITLIGIILALSSLVILSGRIEKKFGVSIEEKNITYIGDNHTKTAYHIKSSNPDCDLKAISELIKEEDLVIFEKEIPSNFNLDKKCN